MNKSSFRSAAAILVASAVVLTVPPVVQTICRNSADDTNFAAAQSDLASENTWFAVSALNSVHNPSRIKRFYETRQAVDDALFTTAQIYLAEREVWAANRSLVYINNPLRIKRFSETRQAVDDALFTTAQKYLAEGNTWLAESYLSAVSNSSRINGFSEAQETLHNAADYTVCAAAQKEGVANGIDDLHFADAQQDLVEGNPWAAENELVYILNPSRINGFSTLQDATRYLLQLS